MPGICNTSHVSRMQVSKPNTRKVIATLVTLTKVSRLWFSEAAPGAGVGGLLGGFFM